MRSIFYPEALPFDSGYLAVGDGHDIYWEQVGNPEGVPVAFLHGGPGAGSVPQHRRFFDPAHYRAVIFDQRGAGRSRPVGETRSNTTGHLIADMERLRAHLGIDRWHLFGGSWGSTLALAYAISHPERCLGLVLRGIFLARLREVDWFLHGMGRFFPEARAAFLAPIPEAERGDLLAAYCRRLFDGDPAVHGPAARAWSDYETNCSTLLPNHAHARSGADKAGDGDVALARLEAHYFANGLFLPDNHILDNLARIIHLPAVIIQGRYDVVCPPESAHDLAAAWPRATLVTVPDAGHSAFEPGICTALVQAMERVKGM